MMAAPAAMQKVARVARKRARRGRRITRKQVWRMFYALLRRVLRDPVLRRRYALIGKKIAQRKAVATRRRRASPKRFAEIW